MAGFVDTHGLTLIAILEADGWSEGKRKKNIALMVKKDHQSVNINPNVVWRAERVESICRNAGISADRYELLLAQIPGLASPADPPPTIQ